MNEPLSAKIDEPSRVWYTFGGNRTFKRDVWLAAQPDVRHFGIMMTLL